MDTYLHKVKLNLDFHSGRGDTTTACRPPCTQHASSMVCLCGKQNFLLPLGRCPTRKNCGDPSDSSIYFYYLIIAGYMLDYEQKKPELKKPIFKIAIRNDARNK